MPPDPDMVNPMNRHEQDIPMDRPLRELDAKLRRAMPVDPPTHLAHRVYQATVADLPESNVVARIGWSSLSGWKYAAAIALVFFYGVLWVKPHIVPTVIPDSEVALIIDTVPDGAVITLDEQIDSLAVELDQFADDLEQNPIHQMTLGADDEGLGEQWLDFEAQLDTAG
jgi:hypothetical protein